MQLKPSILFSHIAPAYLDIHESDSLLNKVYNCRQFAALLQGIKDTNALGAGHGVGVNVIRNVEYPWRYELMPIATIYRIGIIGFMLLTIPFLVYFFEFVRRVITNGVDPFDSFMFSGFAAFLLASATNPYPESFIFQFMLYIPVVLFEMKYRRRRTKGRMSPATGQQGATT